MHCPYMFIFQIGFALIPIEYFMNANKWFKTGWERIATLPKPVQQGPCYRLYHRQWP